MTVEAIKIHTTPINFLSPIFDNKKLFPKTNERLTYLKTTFPNEATFHPSVEEVKTAPQRIQQVLEKYEMEPRKTNGRF